MLSHNFFTESIQTLKSNMTPAGRSAFIETFQPPFILHFGLTLRPYAYSIFFILFSEYNKEIKKVFQKKATLDFLMVLNDGQY